VPCGRVHTCVAQDKAPASRRFSTTHFMDAFLGIRKPTNSHVEAALRSYLQSGDVNDAPPSRSHPFLTISFRHIAASV